LWWDLQKLSKNRPCVSIFWLGPELAADHAHYTMARNIACRNSFRHGSWMYHRCGPGIMEAGIKAPNSEGGKSFGYEYRIAFWGTIPIILQRSMTNWWVSIISSSERSCFVKYSQRLCSAPGILGLWNEFFLNLWLWSDQSKLENFAIVLVGKALARVGLTGSKASYCLPLINERTWSILCGRRLATEAVKVTNW